MWLWFYRNNNKKALTEKIEITLSDIDANAIKQSQINAKINDVKINLVQSNWFEKINDQFDLIVSNPPYLKWSEQASISASVLNYEPHHALFADNDGLVVYQIIDLLTNKICKQILWLLVNRKNYDNGLDGISDFNANEFEQKESHFEQNSQDHNTYTQYNYNQSTYTQKYKFSDLVPPSKIVSIFFTFMFFHYGAIAWIFCEKLFLIYSCCVIIKIWWVVKIFDKS